MKKLFFTSILSVISLLANSQDYHFSQFYFTHFTVNPAYTGKIQQDYRLLGIHRNQWSGIGSQFNTTGLAYDMNFEGDKLGNNIVGLGFFVVNDDFEGGYYKEQELGLAGAWHKPLDGLNRNILSAGVQGSIGQKTIMGPEGLLWSSEFDRWERPIDGTTNAGENYVGGGGKMNFRLNIGIGWSYQVTENFAMNLGASAFNTNKPKETLYSLNAGDTGEREDWRNVLNFGVKYHFNNQLSIHPNLLLMAQAGATDLVYGGFLGYAPENMQNNNVTFYIGPWFRGGWGERSKDALIGAAALEFKNYRLGVSYDFTVSTLNNLKVQDEFQDLRQIGAFEISFTYVGFLKRSQPNDYTIPCKFF